MSMLDELALELLSLVLDNLTLADLTRLRRVDRALCDAADENLRVRSKLGCERARRCSASHEICARFTQATRSVHGHLVSAAGPVGTPWIFICPNNRRC